MKMEQVAAWEVPEENWHSSFNAKFIAQKGWILVEAIEKAFVYEAQASNFYLVKVLEHSRQCSDDSIVVHPSLPYILAAFSDHVALWDWEKEWEKITFEGHALGISGVLAFHMGDLNIFASASRSSTIKIWDISTRSCVQTLVCGDGVTSQLDFCSRPQRSLLLSYHNSVTFSEDRVVLVWDYKKGVCLGRLTMPNLDFYVPKTAFFHPHLPYICTSADADPCIALQNESNLQLVPGYSWGPRSYKLMGIAPCKNSNDVIAFGFRGQFSVLKVVVAAKGGSEESEEKMQGKSFSAKRLRAHTLNNDNVDGPALVSRKLVAEMDDEAMSNKPKWEKRIQQVAADLELKFMKALDALREEHRVKESKQEERVQELEGDVRQLKAEMTAIVEAKGKSKVVQMMEDELVDDTPEWEKIIQQVAANVELKCMEALDALREEHRVKERKQEERVQELEEVVRQMKTERAEMVGRRVVKMEDEEVASDKPEWEK
ncbi:hypothetical protein CBR_g31579 [Chara braunii]|uniref:Uncharacterized protein n=1 Tax=Chara braunii TaxID=69332 RepID=A0A388LFM9_CHABU|nr:hypothetical protein CBR_g31579 [Chara braunii]|eukprot:GBG81023.1 hypothetical protein CBR_g31579 [Chara braunii]